MKENPLISVIVPVYKVEKFLDRCVKSLLGQSYGNIEIILVDDGSPDNCGAMCDVWAETDSRIKVLHKENGGQAMARNQAVAVSSGEYIFFVDSDDYVSPDALEYLVSIMRSSGADIAGASFRIVYGDGELFEGQPEEKLLFVDNIGACRAYFGDYYMQMVAPWGKLFHADIIKRFPFPVGHKHEDEAVIYKIYYYGGNMIISNRQIYAYYQNEGSVTHNRGRKNYADSLDTLIRQLEFFEQEGNDELAAYAADRLCMSVVSLAGTGEEVNSEYIANNPRPQFLKRLPLKRRFLYRFYSIFGIDLNAIALKIKHRK